MRERLRFFACTCSTILLLSQSGIGAEPALPPQAAHTPGASSAAAQEALRQARELAKSDLPGAVAKARAALALARTQNDHAGELDALQYTGMLLVRLNDPVAASDVLRQGLALATGPADSHARGKLLVSQSATLWMLADLPAAVADAAEALRIAEAAGDQEMQFMAHQNLGIFYTTNGDPGNGRLHLEAALRLNEETHNGDQGQILNNLGEFMLGNQGLRQREGLPGAGAALCADRRAARSAA